MVRLTSFPTLLTATFLLLSGCSTSPDFDVVLTGGTVYDGSGETPVQADIGITGDRIASIGDLSGATADDRIDVSGLAVAPGFINMLSWAGQTLIEDGRSMSDIKQGVTLEVLGERHRLAPLNEALSEELKNDQYFSFDIEWTTLGEYLQWLEQKGISPNVASFIPAETVRVHELESEDRPPDSEELERMKALVRNAMEEGALGVASSLIYPPGSYASTEELVELARVAAEFDGMYISHMRSEGSRLLEAVDELIQIAAEADIRTQIHHLKASGEPNWPKLADVIQKVESARAQGLSITADMYTYVASSTSLSAAIPDWVKEGGFGTFRDRLTEPGVRSRLIAEMNTASEERDNRFLVAGADGILLVGFRQDSLRYLTGKTLQEVADLRGRPAAETALDLIVEDNSGVQSVYFMMTEENVRRQVQIPWVSFGSDAGSVAPEGVFLNNQPHPRAYGNFARLLGKYVREEGLISLQEAVRRLTSFPAENLNIEERGSLTEGFFADIAVFDPETITDHATFENPHQLATGMVHVFVNGEQVLAGGDHTGATPGRFVKRAGTDD